MTDLSIFIDYYRLLSEKYPEVCQSIGVLINDEVFVHTVLLSHSFVIVCSSLIDRILKKNKISVLVISM